MSERQGCNVWIKNGRRRVTVGAVNVEDITTVLDPAPVEVTWQIVVGAIGTLTHTNTTFEVFALLEMFLWDKQILNADLFSCFLFCSYIDGKRMMFCVRNWVLIFFEFELCSWGYPFCGGRD